MKTLERNFFKFCCKNIDHNCENITILTFRKMDLEDRHIPINAIELYKSENQEQNYNFADLIEKYVKIHPEVSTKQLCYYIDKWERYRFIECGVSIYYGWFDFSNLPLEYFLIVPDRILSHCKAFENISLNDDTYTKNKIILNLQLKAIKRGEI